MICRIFGIIHRFSLLPALKLSFNLEPNIEPSNIEPSNIEPSIYLGLTVIA